MKTFLAGVLLAAGLAAATVAQATPTLSVQPMVCNGCAHTVSWSNIAAPTSTDWIGLYAPGAANSSYITWHYTTGTAGGSISFNFPGSLAFGNYEMRLFSNGTFNVIATTSVTVAPTLSGTITNAGSGMAGVTMSLSGTPCMTTVSGGGWGCFVPLGWSGTITASAPGYLFTPASRSVSNVTNHLSSQNFATAAVPLVSGTVTSGGSPLSGVAFSASNGGSCTSSNASGQYSCAVPSGWSGAITPSRTDTVFTPASRSYSTVSASQTAQNYASVTNHQVSGTVTLNGLALANVAFAATNGVSCTNTDGSGQYSCSVPDGWTGSVTPSASGYTFSPVSRSYTSVASSQSAQSYAATLVTATAPIYFVQVDHLNTPRRVYDASANLRWKWDQVEPFGDSLPDENPSSLGVFEQPLRFPGQYFDKETNLAYNWYRDYDAAIAAYKQSDPLGPQGGLNTYAYVGAAPVNLVDPSGLTATNPADPMESGVGGLGPVMGGGGGGARFGGGGSPVVPIQSGPTVGGRALGGGTASPQPAPNFVVTPQGQAIPVPSGAVGPIPMTSGGNATGWGYTGGTGGTGLSPSVSTVRIMNPTLPRGPSPGYPSGYVNYMNAQGQSINPYTGRTIAPSNPWWHIPLGVCTAND